MPADFDRCANTGGHVVTKRLPEGRYIHLCYDSKGSHAGEVKTKKKESKKKK